MVIMNFFGLLLVVLVVGALIFWIFQVVSLMRMPDKAFAGRHDKAIWAAVLVLTFVLGAIAFWFWKAAVRADERVEQTAGEIGRAIQESEGKDKMPPH